MKFTFTIPGNPKPQKRPRFARVGNFVKTYDPQDSKDFKAKVALFARQAGITITDKPVKLTITFSLDRPKYLCKKKSDPGFIPCAKRPDLDNLLKAILDGLNGIAWHDDGQIYDIRASKFYCPLGAQPMTEITIETAD